ncbi:MAG: membrane protein insertase YidC [Chlamydiae bacterium]|nr:membrane protein insertase YidC [Chlamydiota bacterium]
MDKRSLLFVIVLTVGLFFINHWFDVKHQEKKVSAQIQPPAEVTPPSSSLEEPSLPVETSGAFYVLENEYQQVVFSSLGGAIAEINLPFCSDKNSKSLILPIDFDSTMETEYSSNDYFPSTSSYQWKEGSLQKVEQGTLGGYYPLLRRSILGMNGQVIHAMPPQYYAFQIASDTENLSEKIYQVKRFEKNVIEFEYADQKRKITKTFFLSSEKTPYCLELSIQVEGDTRGLWMTTGIPEVELISGNFTPTLKYLLVKNQKPQVESLSLPKNITTYSSIRPEWISNCNGFLGTIVQPLGETGVGFRTRMIEGKQVPTRISLIDSHYDLYPAEKYPGYECSIPLRSSQEPTNIRMFAGPYQDDLLHSIDDTLSLTEENPRFSSALSFQGWFTFISEPFAKFLFILMKFFYSLSHSWGFSIILLTIALRIMLYPLNNWSIKSSLKMQQIAPLTAAIQEKHKKDPKRAQMEVIALYREKGVNPLTGCFPILIQIPFLIGMFDLLKSAFELRGARFIPGWIDNLTAPDVVFSWNYPLFFFGTHFHLLPLLLGGVMFLQQRLASPLPKDEKLLTDQQKQQKFMGNIMVVVFTVMFYHFPSGLNLYWLSSMGLGILQQWWMNRKIHSKSSKVVPFNPKSK